MRFFKYLVFFILSIISIETFAAYRAVGYPSVVAQTHTSTCTLLASHFNNTLSNDGQYSYSYVTSTTSYCQIRRSDGGNLFNDLELIPNSCPSTNTWKVAWFDYGTPMPLEVCEEIAPDEYCVYENQTKRITNYPNRQMVTVYSKSTQTVSSCQNKFEGVCDKNDPYGGCYTPPNDGCTRQSDGSIVCPPEAEPPNPEPTCGGATYCVRPPEGCGTGYVSGSFNGQQLCVKSGPSNPPDPEPEPEPQPQPNECSAQYCPKPEPEKDCPTGYYSSYFNGLPICVANNPNPNQPNQNDPNNNENASSEPVAGDDPNTSFDVKGIIDAIKALRDSLLTALDKVSKKITSLVEGQKKTNEHLEKIKDETIKTNDKLDTANGHLTKIEENTKASSDSLDSINDATSATSEAVGETNKKLDQIFSDQGKQQIEQLGEQSTDSRLTNAETEMNSKIQQLANTLSYSSSHACISDFTVTNIPYFGSMTVPLSKWCDLLALVKLLLKLAVLMLALKMIDATVRVF